MAKNRIQYILLLNVALMMGTSCHREIINNNGYFEYIQGASLSNENQRILFAGLYDGSYNLYLYNRQQERLYIYDFKGKLEFIMYPCFSPDGRNIAFSACENGDKNRHIYIMSSTGKGIRKITSGSGSDGDLNYSPDGNSIIYIHSRWYGRVSFMTGPNWRGKSIRLVDLKRQADRELVYDATDQKEKSKHKENVPVVDGRPYIYSDGRTIIFIGGVGPVFRACLVKMSIDSVNSYEIIEPSEPREETLSHTSGMEFPGVSASGKYIVYSSVLSDRDMKTHELYLLSMDNKNTVKRLTNFCNDSYIQKRISQIRWLEGKMSRDETMVLLYFQKLSRYERKKIIVSEDKYFFYMLSMEDPKVMVQMNIDDIIKNQGAQRIEVDTTFL